MKINKKLFLIALLLISELTVLNAEAEERVCKDGQRSYFDVCPEDSNSRPQQNEKIEKGGVENEKNSPTSNTNITGPAEKNKKIVDSPLPNDIINAENVTKVDSECGDGHHLWFKDSDGTGWIEKNDAQNKTYAYKFVSNDKWSLKIQHANVSVEINLRKKKVFWSRGDQNMKCSITKAR
jgi:hypothetical protein